MITNINISAITNYTVPPSLSRPLEGSIDNRWVCAVDTQIVASNTKAPIDWSHTSLRGDIDVLELNVTRGTLGTDDGRNHFAS